MPAEAPETARHEKVRVQVVDDEQRAREVADAFAHADSANPNACAGDWLPFTIAD